MYGAIAGDIIGSVHEFIDTKTKDFSLFVEKSDFTDDSVLTAAVAASILDGASYRNEILDFARRYPMRGYGGRFKAWFHSQDPQPYDSWGNGSAMRVSAVGLAFDNRDSVLAEAERSADCTHNHPEGVKGAQATALAIFLARNGADKETIRRDVSETFGYDLDRTVDGIRPGYGFEESCQDSVPESIVAFLDADSYVDAVRNAVSLGGDADTQACIAGGIAEAFYGGVPDDVMSETRRRLPQELLDVMDRLYDRFPLER